MVPSAIPRAMGRRTRAHDRHDGPNIAPMVPVSTTTAAVNDGSPPCMRLSSTAIAVVTDLAASETSTGVERPNAAATPSIVNIVASDPATTPATRGSNANLSWRRCKYTGTANAAVAGPNGHVNSVLAGK